jgi:hypothetical protein
VKILKTKILFQKLKKMIKKLFILTCCIVISSLFYYCNKQEPLESANDKSFIVKFNVELMVRNHFTKYELVRNGPKWNYGREFVYKINDNNEVVFITVGLNPSAEDAENIVIKYLNEISMAMTDRPHMGISIGDKCWWATNFQDSSILTNIVFIRKNALIKLISLSYGDLKALAKSIDEDITKGASYLKYENVMITPEIKSISMGKNSVKENDTLKITIKAIDPKNESLEYQFIPGLIKYESDPENVFTLNACYGLIQEPYDSLTIKIVAINESNAVSPNSEVKIKIIK